MSSKFKMARHIHTASVLCTQDELPAQCFNSVERICLPRICDTLLYALIASKSRDSSSFWGWTQEVCPSEEGNKVNTLTPPWIVYKGRRLFLPSLHHSYSFPRPMAALYWNKEIVVPSHLSDFRPATEEMLCTPDNATTHSMRSRWASWYRSPYERPAVRCWTVI
jgi:hypothetical protein